MRAMTWPFLTMELKSTNSSLIWPETWLPTWTVMTALRVPLADTAAVSALRAVQALQGPVEGEIDHGVLATRRDVHAQELLGGTVQGVERAKVPERQTLERNDEPRDVSAGVAHITLIQIDGRRARTAQDHVLRDVAAMPAAAFDGREGGCFRVELLE